MQGREKAGLEMGRAIRKRAPTLSCYKMFAQHVSACSRLSCPCVWENSSAHMGHMSCPCLSHANQSCLPGRVGVAWGGGYGMVGVGVGRK